MPLSSCPLVSIIVPCFRQAQYLAGAVDSALTQSYPNVEVVVVNDGSDDDTEGVARRYGDNIRFLSKTNGGLPSARNAGIRAASGQYLLFLDADDLLHTDAVTWLVEASQGMSDCLCVMGYRVFREESALIDTPEPKQVENPVQEQTLIHQNFGPPHAFLSCREMVIRVGLFEESLRSCEDWDLWLRLILAGAHLSRITNVGAYYRDTSGSMSKNKVRMLQTRTEVLIRTHDAISIRNDLLSHWGSELLEAHHRVRRRWLVQGNGTQYVNELTKRIDQLLLLGYTRRQSFAKRAIGRLLGDCLAEQLTIAYLQQFDPGYYHYYERGYY